MALRYNYETGQFEDDGMTDIPDWDILPEVRDLPANYIYADEYHKGVGGGEGLPPEGIESPGMALDWSKIWSGIKNIGGKAVDYVSNNPGQVGLMAALAALGALSKAPPSGGGVKKAYKGPAQQLTRTITQGRYGPIAQYAAQGGIMHAYAHGGQVKPVAMEDGGFVMTKRAVDGAGGPQGIQALLPGARPIHGPGTGTSDSIPAYIQGRNGTTPARVSNGEAYVPRRAQPPGGTRELYAMMRQLERRA